MLPGRLGVPLSQENKLWLSWHDSTWIPILNPSNIMDYFSQKSNIFYDRTCNNENVRMQRLGLEQLTLKMLPGRLGVPLSQENKLWLSWHDSTWIPILNPSNIMDYFSQKSNIFYDRTCNNENVRMQRLGLEQLTLKMLPGRLGVPLSQENKLWLSWHDSTWIPILNPSNIMDYFSQKSNIFYDRTCNNENVRMQRLGLEQLTNMTGIEYILLHVAEPILYVIRKQHRHTPTDVTPLVDYYIIAGVVYQAPDLANVFNSRILSTVTHLQSAFEEASSYSRYHPNKGYSWDFSANKALSDKSKSGSKKDSSSAKDEPGSLFQRQRVDMLLGELLRKFPPPLPPQFQHHQQQQQQQQSQQAAGVQNQNAASNPSIKTEPQSQDQQNTTIIKQEPIDNPSSNNPAPSEASPAPVMDIKMEPNEMKPPPEKKMKLQ